MNHFAFTGTVVDSQRRVTGSGRTITTLVLSDGREKPSLCVCDYWGEADCMPGEKVCAVGRLTGREYKGKHYAGLTAECIVALDAAPSAAPTGARPASVARPPAASTKPAQTSDNTPAAQDDIPF